MAEKPKRVKTRSSIGTKQQALLEHVQLVLEELRDFWPMTLRQLYYQLVARGVLENSLGKYKRLSELMTKARLGGLVPWEALEDRAREMLYSGGWANQRAFVEVEIERFLEGYRRDLMQSQPHVLELWIEKDALSRIVHDVAWNYCIPVVVARGFSSVSYLHECRSRVERNAKVGKRTKILYFGDLDPSGWEMLPAMLRTLQVEMGLGDLVEGIRCALLPSQVEQYQLPRSIDAMKESDPRTPKFKAMLRQQGYPDDLAVELDALPPALLQGLVQQAIEANLDMALFEEERRLQDVERAHLGELRSKVRAMLASTLGE
jgi:hypothetical protein